MTVLPIVERELRVAARRRGTWRARFWSALVAILVCGWVFLIMAQPSTPPSEMGQSLFTGLAALAFVYCAAAGIRVTSDCLSEEKREGTLGLLFLTDLRGYDVVFGKLVATSLNSMYGLLAILPVLALPLLLGGVEPHSVWRTALALVNALFLSLSVGMFISAVCRNERRAMLGTLLVLLSLTVGLPTVRFILDEILNRPPPLGPDVLLLPSPAFAVIQAVETLGTLNPNRHENFVLSMVTIHIMAWAFLALASGLLPRAWHERPPGTVSLRWRDRWQRWTQGAATLRHEARRRLLAVNPFLWLAGRDRFKTDLVWTFLGLVGVVWFWGWIRIGRDWLSLEMGIATALLLHVTLKCWLASEACRRFVEDRRSGALELVLSTPVTVEEILHGQLLAVRRQFGGPILVVLFVDLLLMVVAAKDSTVSSGDRREELTLWLAAMFTLVTDAYTLSWVGMWQGLTARSANRATVATLFWVLVLPWCLVGVLATLVAVFDLGMRFANGTAVVISVLVVFFTFLNAGYWVWARLRLRSGFRTVATLRFQPQKHRGGWWPFSLELDGRGPRKSSARGRRGPAA
jgi:ABC-type transport system involved in cytochrome c biogenesis permease component